MILKKNILLLFTLLAICTSFSQEITGEWHGSLQIQGTELPLVFHISKTETGLKSKLDSPKQNAFGIPMDSTSFKNDSLFISSKMGISYTGSITGKEGIVGNFMQNGMVLKLNLSRKNTETTAQTQTEPKPYHSENVFFENEKAGIVLGGTLAFPKGKEKFPAVVLISGSGAQTRKGNKPFLALSDFLVRNGIAVLHYDDRGVGESEGDMLTATSANFATDVEAAVDFLRSRNEINSAKIGLIGHSEGGMIAPMVASKSDKVAFLVLMAAPGIPGNELLVLQNRLIGKAHGMTEPQLAIAEKTNRSIYDIIINSPKDSLKTNLTNFLKEISPNIPETQLNAEIKMMSYPWMKFFLKYDPRPALEKTKVPVLAINGGNDLQVPAEINLNAIETALKKGGNNRVTIEILPGMNHLFQESETGLPSEYGNLEQKFSAETMELISNWIKSLE